MAKFEIAYKKTSISEAGYANDPDDKGGETWKGIARKYNSKWPGWKIIDEAKKSPNFPKEIPDKKEYHKQISGFLSGLVMLESYVQDLYRAVYWNQIRGDAILVQASADSLYDSAVNMGPTQAVKLAQKALNIRVNGVMDDPTLKRINGK